MEKETKYLKPMVEFVLELDSRFIEQSKTVDGFLMHAINLKQRSLIVSYAKLLSREPILGMFIPCSEDGEVLEYPKKEDYDQEDLEASVMGCDVVSFQEAESRVLFKGWELDEKSNVIINHDLGCFLTINLSDEIFINDLANETTEEIKTLEDLAPYRLKLKQKL